MTRIITIPVHLETHRESIDVFLSGDIHYPDPGTVLDSWHRWRGAVVENVELGRKTFNALMGDYCSVYVNGDKRKAPSNQLPDPLLIYSKMRDWIRPLAPTNVCTLTGNHDEDWWKTENIDFVNWMCAELGLNYGGYESLVTFEIYRENSDKVNRYIDMVLWHGTGGGRTRGGAINASARPVEVHKYADIVAVGHTHRLGKINEQNIFPQRRGNKPEEHVLDFDDKNQFIVMTGGYQKGYLPDRSTYISSKMLPPVSIGGVKLRVTPFKDVGGTDMVDVVLEQIY